VATADKRSDEAGLCRPRRVAAPTHKPVSMPEPVEIEYRRALALKGFSKTVKVKARSRRSSKAKVSFRLTCRKAGGKTVRKQIKVKK